MIKIHKIHREIRKANSNSLSKQETADVLPPPGFPMQKAEPSVSFPKNYNRQEMDRESAGSQTGRNMSDELEQYLTKIYYDTKNPASYSGIENFIIM